MQSLVELILQRPGFRQSSCENNCHHTILNRLQRRLASAQIVDTVGNVSSPHEQLALKPNADGMMGGETMPRRMIYESLDHVFSIDPIAAPEKDGDCKDKCETKAQRLLKPLRFVDGVFYRSDGSIRSAGEPEPPRQGDQREKTIVVSKVKNVGPRGAGILHHGALAKLDRFALIADHMMPNAERPFDIQRAGRLVQLFGNGFSASSGLQCAMKVSGPGIIDLQNLEHPQLPMPVVQLLGKLQAAHEGGSDRFLIALREHRGDAECSL